MFILRIKTFISKFKRVIPIRAVTLSGLFVVLHADGEAGTESVRLGGEPCDRSDTGRGLYLSGTSGKMSDKSVD